MDNNNDLELEMLQREDKKFDFRLYITGASPNSSRAVANLKAFCEKYLPERYQLEVIDVYQQPQILEAVNIVAIPLLVKRSPFPERRFIGDLSDSEKLLKSLNLVF